MEHRSAICVWALTLAPDRPVSAAPAGNTFKWFTLLGDIRRAFGVWMIQIQWNSTAGSQIIAEFTVMFSTSPLVLQALVKVWWTPHLAKITAYTCVQLLPQAVSGWRKVTELDWSWVNGKIVNEQYRQHWMGLILKRTCHAHLAGVWSFPTVVNTPPVTICPSCPQTRGRRSQWGRTSRTRLALAQVIEKMADDRTSHIAATAILTRDRWDNRGAVIVTSGLTESAVLIATSLFKSCHTFLITVTLSPLPPTVSLIIRITVLLIYIYINLCIWVWSCATFGWRPT